MAHWKCLGGLVLGHGPQFGNHCSRGWKLPNYGGILSIFVFGSPLLPTQKRDRSETIREDSHTCLAAACQVSGRNIQLKKNYEFLFKCIHRLKYISLLLHSSDVCTPVHLWPVILERKSLQTKHTLHEEVPKKQQFRPFWPYRALGGTIVNVRGNSQKPEVFMG